MRRFLAIILAIGLAGSVLAQGEKATESLVIAGPFYSLTNSTTGATYTISGPPGTYLIPGQAITPGLTPVNVTITVTIPKSIDPPPPPPNGIVGKMWVVLVADTNSAPYAAPGSFQSQLWGSTTIAPALATAPVSAMWRHYDLADPLTATTNWGKAATKMGLPCLVIVDEKGVASPVAMPLDEAGIVAAAKKARGL